MRLRFEQQLKLGIVPISEVKLNIKSRHGLVPVLRALQYAFKTQELNEQIFEILEQEVKSGLQETGRYGMSLWEILVLGVVRLTENMDYDRLHDLANEHHALSGILGIQRNDYTSGKEYHLQSMKDNVRLLSDEKIYEISDI
ncbi:MAG: ISNCY family transposase, partial [Bacteroidota bacterium]